MDRDNRASVYDVYHNSSIECGSRSAWMERLTVLWAESIDWKISNDNSDRILETDCGTT